MLALFMYDEDDIFNWVDMLERFYGVNSYNVIQGIDQNYIFVDINPSVDMYEVVKRIERITAAEFVGMETPTPEIEYCR